MKLNAVIGTAIALWTFLAPATMAHAALATLDAKNKQPTRLRAVTGRPCLTFHELVRAQIAMKGTYDHVVTVENQCPETILVKVCYRNATIGCRKLRVSAHKKASALLGSMYNQPSFAFEYTEAYAD